MQAFGQHSVWVGRDDGPGKEHARWHSTIVEASSPAAAAAAAGKACRPAVLVGFASDEGVARNKGRVGAAEGPAALRQALAPLAVHDDGLRIDAGTVRVSGNDLEDGQRRLAEAVAHTAGVADSLTVVLGGGHETAYGSHWGLRNAVGEDTSVAIINLDAHFDLRSSDKPTSGTPFRQISSQWPGFNYSVFGISRSGNTAALFSAAKETGTRFWTDVQCAEMGAAALARELESVIADVDVVHLSIDLDVLPAAVAPGVSAPAGLGVELAIIRALAVAAAASGKLRLVDVVELCPHYDIDGRTARTAARLIDDIVIAHQQAGASKKVS